MVGPFFYIDDKELDYHGFLFDGQKEQQALHYGDHITSVVGHDQLFESTFRHADQEYFDYPRGRVVFHIPSQSHIIYVDRCIQDKKQQIATLFDLTDYSVKRDDHYCCPSCMK